MLYRTNYIFTAPNIGTKADKVTPAPLLLHCEPQARMTKQQRPQQEPTQQEVKQQKRLIGILFVFLVVL
jgi:hypothetical protein